MELETIKAQSAENEYNKRRNLQNNQLQKEAEQEFEQARKFVVKYRNAQLKMLYENDKMRWCKELDDKGFGVVIS